MSQNPPAGPHGPGQPEQSGWNPPGGHGNPAGDQQPWSQPSAPQSAGQWEQPPANQPGGWDQHGQQGGWDQQGQQGGWDQQGQQGGWDQHGQQGGWDQQEQWDQQQPWQGQPGSQGGSYAGDPYAADPNVNHGGWQATSGSTGWQQTPGGASWNAGATVQKKTGPLPMIVALLVIAALVAGGIWAAKNFGSGSVMKVGNCVTITKKGASDYDTKKADCGDTTGLVYVVAAKLKGGEKCQQPYSSFSYGTSKKETAVYCLMENLAVGKCYAEAKAPNEGWRLVPCSSSAEFKVAARHDGVSDAKRCSREQQPIAFRLDPKRTYCLGDPAR